MNNIIKLFICIAVIFGMGSLPSAQTKPQPKEDNFQDHQAERQRQILDGDYVTAKQAVCEAVVAKDILSIKLALKQRRFGPAFQSDAVNAAKQINDKEFVPDLINVLEKNQNIAWRGGSEIEFQQKELDKAIISALEQLTGLQFHCSNQSSSEKIQEVLEKSREWWKVYQSKNK